jgi:hypothetical protein
MLTFGSVRLTDDACNHYSILMGTSVIGPVPMHSWALVMKLKPDDFLLWPERMVRRSLHLRVMLRRL